MTTDLDGIRKRATAQGGKEFAEIVLNQIESYRTFDPKRFPAWPSPAAARDEAAAITRAVEGLFAAMKGCSEAVRARLRVYAQEDAYRRSGPVGQYDMFGRFENDAKSLAAAAARIEQEQPATKRPDEMRQGFLLMLRELFGIHKVAFTSSWSDAYEKGSLAVEVVVAATDMTPAAAAKAIERLPTDSP